MTGHSRVREKEIWIGSRVLKIPGIINYKLRLRLRK